MTVHKALNDIQRHLGVPITPQPQVSADDVCYVLYIAALIYMNRADMYHSQINLLYRDAYRNFRAKIGVLKSKNVVVEFQMIIDEYMRRGDIAYTEMTSPVVSVEPVAPDETESVTPVLVTDAETVTVQVHSVDPQPEVIEANVPLQGIRTDIGDSELVVEHTCSA